MNPQDEILLKQAQEAAPRAYAPYSHFRVGVALRSQNGNIYSGCNVENISYPLGSCAERSAISAMISAEGPSARIDTLAVYAINADGQTPPCSPCGGCRQWIAEFGPARVIYPGAQGFKVVNSQELLPHRFIF